RHLSRRFAHRVSHQTRINHQRQDCQNAWPRNLAVVARPRRRGDRVRRREFITLLGGTAAWPLVALAQQRKVPTIGVLVVEASGLEQFWRLFREDMAELGYVEGRNIRYEFRSDQGQISRASALAAELVRLNVDLIVTWFTPAALTGDPIANGLVESL